MSCPSSGKPVREAKDSYPCWRENDPTSAWSERERETGMIRIPAERRVP